MSPERRAEALRAAQRLMAVKPGDPIAPTAADVHTVTDTLLEALLEIDAAKAARDAEDERRRHEEQR